jgi:hypothetical protein
MATRTKKYLYQLLFFIISVVFIIFFIRQFGQISEAVNTLAGGVWYFLIAVIALVALGIVNRGAYYHSLYGYFGAQDSLRRLTILSLSSNFLNLAAPSGGASGAAVFISEAQRHGMTKTKATFVYLFSIFLIYFVFLLILLFGLFYLLFNHQLQKYQIITAAALFGILLAALIAMLVTLESAAKLKKLFRFISGIVNFFTRIINRKHIISGEEVQLVSQEMKDCVERIERQVRHLALPVFHVLLMEAIDILALYYIFLAFNYPIYPGILITVYAIGVLFSLMSITPSGVGVVEATMIVVLTGLKVPVELATIAVIVYRLFTFWVPFILGYIAFRLFQKEKIVRLERSKVIG